jgi:hypothetical protein
MGDTCGPCFDRRAEGGTASGGFGQFGGWAPNLVRFGFSPDGRHLVGQNRIGAFWKVNRDDGTAAIAKRKTYNQVVAVGTDAGGVTMVTQVGSAHRWAEGASDIETVLPSKGVWGRVALTPDGHHVALVGYQNAYTIDLTAARTQWARHHAPEGLYAIQYAPDGSRLLATTIAGEVRAVNPATMTSEVVRGDAFDGPGSWAGAPDLVVSPDGATVLMRRESYSPRRTVVRRVPLPAGKVTELRLPPWHRPTSMAFAPDGRIAVTAESEGGWVGFFDLSNGKALGFVRAVLEDLSWKSGQIEFSPDGGALAVSYNAGRYELGSTVALWPWPDTMLAAGAV